jgi:hypothetical protein
VTASARLRVEVELAAPAVAHAGRRLLEHPRASELFPAYLAVGYHVAAGMIRLMETALAEAQRRARGDAVAAGLTPYLARHIGEELHGAEPGGAVLDDLAALGADVEALRRAPPPPTVEALLGAQRAAIIEQHPAAVLGFLQLEALHPHRPAVDRLIAATGLPRKGFRQLLLHTKLDIVHARELARLVDSLPLEPAHERLIGIGALQTITLLGAALREVLEP